MSSVPCTNCGAVLLPGAKFCRMCGQPSLDTASVSEATTRVFEATAERPGAATQAWQAQPTGPAYMSPAGASPLKDATTKSLQPAAQTQKKGGLVISFAVLFLAVVFAFAVGMMLKGRMTTTTPTQTPPTVTVPGTGLPPPPPPPPPIEDQAAAGPSVPTSELMYPGAQTVMDMKTGRDNFLQLHSTDKIDKVTDWYMAKLKPTQIMRRGTEAVLRSGQTHIILTGSGEATEILIKQGVEK
ncbi:MAG TPA: zinc ribbon domain-containing protein [Pyrinomonadaceae bacterium]